MPRYIDVSKIKLVSITLDADGDALVSLSDVRKAIEQTPTEDVVEVVRCKDCKHYYTDDGCDGWYACDIEGGLYEPDALDFCSYGERKEQV